MKKICMAIFLSFLFLGCVAPSRRAEPTIKGTIQSYMGHFTNCYSKYDDFDSGKPSEGDLAVIFVVTPSGDVGSAGVEEGSTLKEEVQQCVIHVFKDIKFTPVNSGKAVKMRHKFKFSAK
ncbi:MAG: AgmX/PglI C-terminal domain-containing protein [Bacteriovoracaceae bacterium]|nr:AgmX/PglI C-terminal domain-containing protein [Bacteriovoracaceae bacterium]